MKSEFEIHDVDPRIISENQYELPSNHAQDLERGVSQEKLDEIGHKVEFSEETARVLARAALDDIFISLEQNNHNDHREEIGSTKNDPETTRKIKEILHPEPKKISKGSTKDPKPKNIRVGSGRSSSAQQNASEKRNFARHIIIRGEERRINRRAF